MTERLARFIIVKERWNKSVLKNRRANHLIFVTQWSKELGVPQLFIPKCMSQMYEFSVAAGGRPWHISRSEVSPCKMTKEHRNKLGPGTKAFCMTLGTLFYEQFLKIDT